MICEYITQYLLLNKRLVVPGLGAFVVNPANGELIFVELLKQDDGVLMRQLMADGLSAIEAANVIDRFVFEVRHRVDSGGVAMLNGIGRLSKAEDGLYRFEYDPEVGREIAVPAETPAPIETPASEMVAESALESDITVETEAVADVAPAEPVKQVDEESAAPAENSEESKPAANVVAEPAPLPKYERPIMEPESYVKGLRYGKPQRPSKDDIRYVGHSTGRGVDKFVIVAVVAALLAIGAIVYGWLSSREQEDIYGYDEPIEQFDESLMADPADDLSADMVEDTATDESK